MKPPAEALKRVYIAADDPDVGAGDLGVMIEGADGLADSLLRYVGTFYGWLRGEVTDPQRATALLGPRVAGQVALQQALARATDRLDMPETLQGAFWTECIRRGLTARLLSEHVEDAHLDVSLTVGLCLEFGVIILLDRHPQLLRWHREVRPLTGRARIDKEIEIYGRDHVAAFVQSARQWQVPEVIVSAVAAHHANDPRPTSAEFKALQTVAKWSDRLGEALTTPAAGPAIETWVQAVSRAVGIETREAWGIVEKVLEWTPKAAESLGVSVPDQPTLEALRNRERELEAQEMTFPELLEWSTLLKEENDLIRNELEHLREEVDTLRYNDILTNLPTLRRMRDLVRGEVARARSQSGKLCLICIDIDNFKNINMTMGYEVGDKVLVRVAQVLRHVLRDADHIGRIGADSFAVLTSNEPRLGRIVTERTCAALESMHIDVGEKRIRLTATVAGIALSSLRNTVTADQFLAIGERFLSEAQKQGQNRSSWYD